LPPGDRRAKESPGSEERGQIWEAARTFAEAIPDGLIVSDLQGEILYVNRHTACMTGYEPEELVGQRVEVLVPPELAEMHRTHRAAYRRDPRTRPMGSGLEITCHRKDGTKLPVDIALSPVDTPAGPVVVATMRDATERKRAQAQLERLALLEDRERIARELHDGVIQSLFAAGMALEATYMVDDLELIRSRLRGAIDGIDSAIRDVRHYIFGLRPGILATGELENALYALVEELSSGSAVTLEADIDSDVTSRLSDRAVDVVQIAREALSNAIRHSGADLVLLRVGKQGEGALLEVEDDGSGFELESVQGKGQGLINIRLRAEHLKGDVDLVSTPGRGTRVRVHVPF
jgi:PAS domain S-box-containing protein